MKRGLLALAGAAAAIALAGSPAAAATHTAPSPAGGTVAATATAAAPAAAAAVSRATVLRIARSQLGYRERGNNCTKYGPCEEWCSLFATWVWRHAGVAIPSYAFTGDVYRWGQRHHLAYGRAALRQAKPGDVLLFGTGPGTTRTSTHIGIVERVAAGRVTLIEGNSSNRVQRVTHPLSSNVFYGGVRP
ncbi:MAG: peptidoglycan DL-endopeptidase CwlO [Mycobacteriales bacterium]